MMSNRPNMSTLLDFTNRLWDAFLHKFDVIQCIIFLKDGVDSIELDQSVRIIFFKQDINSLNEFAYNNLFTYFFFLNYTRIS